MGESIMQIMSAIVEWNGEEFCVTLELPTSIGLDRACELAFNELENAHGVEFPRDIQVTWLTGGL